MLRDHERKNILTFLTKHASDDILIAAMNRAVSNIEDTKVLMEWCNTYKPNVSPVIEKDEAPPEAPTIDKPFVADKPEDLGPVPKKLGANGQAIQKYMEKNSTESFSIVELNKTLKLTVAKIKPMLALLIERDLIIRMSNNTYRIKG